MNGSTRRRITLTGSVVGAVLVALDGTVLTVAQPALQDDLGASLAQVQWTSTGYLIAVASLLVFAGRLGDRYGHTRLFGYGMLGFAAASAGIGVAPDIRWVIGLRVLQGVCGALLQPATLGMLRTAYAADALGMPIALRTSAIGVAAAAGPLVGGALTAQLGWRSVFFLGVLPAVAIAALVLAVRDDALERPGDVPADDRTTAPAPRVVGLDPGGALLLAVALGCLVAALAGLPGAGWTAGTTLFAAGACAAATGFIAHERRTADPLLSPALLTSPAVAPALAILLTASAALFGTLFTATYFLQDVLGLDPLGTALRMLPAALCMVLAAPLTPVLLRRCGTRATTSGGMLILAAGVFGFGRLDTSAPQLAITACAFAMGTGFGTVMVAATESLVRRADLGAAGVAGGLQQTAMNVGPTLGVATATTLLASGADFVASMGVTLTALAALVLVAGATALRLPGRTPKAAVQARTETS